MKKNPDVRRASYLRLSKLFVACFCVGHVTTKVGPHCMWSFNPYKVGNRWPQLTFLCSAIFVGCLTIFTPGRGHFSQSYIREMTGWWLVDDFFYGVFINIRTNCMGITMDDILLYYINSFHCPYELNSRCWTLLTCYQILNFRVVCAMWVISMIWPD